MADGKIYITVILPLKIEWEPYYIAPQEVRRGDRVSVTFSGRHYVGVVDKVKVSPQAGIGRIMEIDRVEPLEKISSEELRLWDFIADYYLCTIGEVYKAAYPHWRVKAELSVVRAAQKLKETEAKRQAEAEARVERARARLLERLAKRETALANPHKNSVRERLEREKAEILALLETLTSSRAPEAKSGGAATGTDGLDSQGHKAQGEGTENGKVWTGEAFGAGRKAIALTQAQERAKEGIKEAFSEGRVTLLNGITGSGKTEIYIELALQTLHSGKNVLYLSPAIALSGQLEDRLRKAFGDGPLVIFHSGQNPAARAEVVRKVRNEQYVVLGTRSALLLPHRNLGLIIVDEEHDGLYKQDSGSPRYQGRDTAVMLGGIHRANVLLGSATPSFESIYNCATGRYRMVCLTERYYGSKDAELTIIDTMAERRKNGMVGNFSRKLVDEIKNTLARGRQVLVLRAHRAYSPLVQCSQCGDIPRCAHCNVSLSYHRTTGRLVCHHCGYSLPYTSICSKCGGHTKPIGAGTQRIEEELMNIFPDATVARLDADSDSKEVVRNFGEGSTDILVGTQSVSKGLDFGNVALVAVLQADAITGQQDFRADERALQIFGQFRGRCGRRAEKGLFIIQTSRPNHPIYTLLQGTSRAAKMMDDMLRERLNFGYPPYVRLINIVLRDRDESRLGEMASLLAQTICQSLGLTGYRSDRNADGEQNQTNLHCQSFQVVGPFAPPVDKVADEHMLHIRVHLPKDRALTSRKHALQLAVRDFGLSHRWSSHIVIDVDPL